MPWFRRTSGQEGDGARLAEQEASIAALVRGDLPVNALRRLERVREGTTSAFTSDLSVSEFLLCRQAGMTPICQVAGSAIYRVVSQVTLMGSGEVTVLSQGINEARSLALARLQQEAEQVNAHAVLAIRLIGRRLDWSEHAMEFTAIGTAMRLETAPEGAAPALSNLSGGEFWKLYTAGYWPLGICAATAVYNVYMPQLYAGVGGSLGWYNRELPHFSEGMYRARDIAIRGAYSQANRLGASGMIGMTVNSTREAGEVQTQDASPARMTFTFNVIGTAIAREPHTTGMYRRESRMVLNVRQ